MRTKYRVTKPILNCKESVLSIAAGGHVYCYRIRPLGDDRSLEIRQGDRWNWFAILNAQDEIMPTTKGHDADIERILNPTGLVVQAVRCARCNRWLEAEKSMQGGMGPQCREHAQYTLEKQ